MEIRRMFGPTMASLFAVAVVLALPGTAAGLGQKGPQSYYLALGDSIAYGYQPGKDGGPGAFDTGYVDPFAAHLRKLSPKIEVVNYGCPGESSVTFTKGGCPALREGPKLHDPFRGAQLKAALTFLRAHKGQVSPITLTLWGNDLAPLSARGKGAPKAIASFASRLDSILAQLRSAAPTADIIVTGAWNPEIDQFKKTEPLYRSLDAAIARSAAASRARVAKMFPVFNPPGNVRRICALSFICSKGDPHPNDAGYRAMADAFFAASGYPRKP
jgi:lysophospholipase L1-like esterase